MKLQPGAELRGGTYKIVRTLGQGGFGITYLAFHELLDKEVAIKEFFPKDFCNRDGDTSHVTVATTGNVEFVGRLRAKFIKEARNIARFDQPNIVKIYDVFEENGTAYYVMDYIKGHSLGDIIKTRGPLPLDEALSYLRQVGAALEYIHGRHINHLDVKPDNIMVREADNRPMLIDFGLAKQYDSEGGETSTTPVGRSSGYAPLEQYRKGGLSTFSPQADVYALGATLYKMLTGQTPPEAMDLISAPLQFPATVPANVADAIRKAMTPDSGGRYASVADFLAALSAAPVGVPAKKPKSEDTEIEIVGVEPADEEQKKSKAGLIVAAAALFAVACALIFGLKNCGGSPAEVPVADSLAAPVDTIKTDIATITAPEPATPKEEPKKEEPKPAPVVQQAQHRTSPRHLDLAASKGGTTYYFTQSEWAKVSDKSTFTKKGVVVIGSGQRFILALHDSGREMTWDEAMSTYGHRLPTKAQAEAMGADRKAINSAIIAFGGDKDPEWFYWTRTEIDSTYAWYVYMNSGIVFYYLKTTAYRVRAVAPVPASAM